MDFDSVALTPALLRQAQHITLPITGEGRTISNPNKYCPPFFLYARPEAQSLLKPLVVSWGYEAELPGPLQFVDHNEWWGTRDLSAFLSVPAAIKFQQKHGWDKVRVVGHALVREAEERICSLTGLPSLSHSLSGSYSPFHLE